MQKLKRCFERLVIYNLYSFSFYEKTNSFKRISNTGVEQESNLTKEENYPHIFLSYQKLFT